MTPGETYSLLVCGLVMMFASPYVIIKIYRPSKSTCAYVLMAFTFFNGATDFALFFVMVYRHPISVDG
jgi:hypothetical protein